ncbi:hypothetical protein LNKW23_46390 [Paralimibaculum aggregatum]|uniref:Concanavalin A-like lectin/glucanase superfamily protein n=1 Tax=Paralimibaculum aggregatum TaxID=3036245 RepID=A0ABQ6LTL5_9RHOB|nr:hypothetical protein [Limibaculum sp. NKW23]GMG85419.1 hypothetical protein LNKW23_46390 [Limibaculum sp. NKW23]
MSLILGIVSAATPPLNGSGPHVESGSLAMPTGNRGVVPGEHAYLEAATGTDPYLAADGALVAVIEVPWAAYGYAAAERFTIFGNTADPAPAEAGAIALDGERLFDGAGNRLHFTLRSAAGTATLQYDLPGDEQRLTVAVRSSGGALSIDVFSEGVKLAGGATGPVSHAGGAIAAGGLLVGLPGLDASMTPDTAGNGFTGSIRFLGYHDGALADGELAAISAGAGADTAGTAASWRFARELTDHEATSFPAASWATGDVLPDWTKGGAAAFRPGSDIVPAHDAGNTFSLATIQDGTVWGALPGEAVAFVALSGSASGVSGPVELRTLRADGSVIQDWAEIPGSTISGGAWSGSILRMLFTDGWGHVEVRPRDMPAMVQRSRARCGAGHVFTLVGQSNVGTSWNGSAATRQPAGAGPFSVVMSLVDFNEPGSGNVVVRVIDDAAPCPVNWAGAAEEWGLWSSTPCMVIDVSVHGAGHTALLDDANTQWQWSDVTRSTDLVGAAVSAHLINWEVSVNTRADLDHLIDGLGSPYARYLRDGDPFPPGAGIILARADGAALNFPSATYPTWTQDFDVIFATPIATGERRSAPWTAGELWQDYAAEKGYLFGSMQGDRKLDGGHADGDASQERACRRNVVTLARWAGETVQADPYIGTVTMSGDNRTIIVTVDKQGAAGDLTTEWIERGETPHASESPVQGFHTWEPSETHPSRSAGVATIADAAAGIIHITKADGTEWEAGTELFYWTGAQLCFGRALRNERELWKGAPRIRSAHEGGMGLPLAQRPRIDDFIMARPWTPAERFASGETGDWWIIEPDACVRLGGGTPSVGDQVERISGQRGQIDWVHDGALGTVHPVLRQNAAGAYYLEIPSGGALVTDTGHSAAGLLFQWAASDLAPVLGNTQSFLYRSNGAGVEWALNISGATRKIAVYANDAPHYGVSSIDNIYQADWAAMWADPHLHSLRFGASVSAGDHGYSFDRHSGTFSPGTPTDLADATSHPVQMFRGLFTGHFYGGLMVDDPAILRRQEMGYFDARFGGNRLKMQF